ncbi:discoidin domain-containing protein [bacterium]|nr:discoidin domain-containing protein [bacterium]
MKKWHSFVIIFLILILTACKPAATLAPATPTNQSPTDAVTETAPTPTPPPPAEHVISIRIVDGEAEFFNRNTGEKFIPRGTNYIHIVRTETNTLQDRLLGTADFESDAIRVRFQRLSELGYNTVRIFMDSCNRGPTCITNGDQPGLNPDYLDNLATLMQIAIDEGIFLLLTSNDLPTGGGYDKIADRDPSTNPMVTAYRNGQMLTASGHEATTLYWDDLMAGLVARGAAFDAVLAWQLFNEQWLFTDQPPLSRDTGIYTGINGVEYDLSDPDQKRTMVADHLMRFIETMRAVILKHDPTALVTMGFFTPDFPNPTRVGDNRFLDIASLIERDAPLDFYDIHPYPGEPLTIPEMAENFAVLDHPAKPTLIGEYGAFKSQFATLTTAARAMGDWAANFCRLGADGYLYWTLTELPAAIGDATRGLEEGENFMLELFAPVNQPDPCTAPEVPSSNLAYDAIVMASTYLPDELPEYAVDEKANTQWGSGALPPQWIQLDLGEETTISTIRLLVAQYPSGNTTHEIRVRSNDKTFEVVHTFSQLTSNDLWLIFTPETPLENIRYVRIVTLSSPSWVSWKEIEIE